MEKLPLTLMRPGSEMTDVSFFVVRKFSLKSQGISTYLYLTSLSCPADAEDRSVHALKMFGYFCLIAYT